MSVENFDLNDFNNLVLLDVKREIILDDGTENGKLIKCQPEHTEVLKSDIRRWLSELNAIKRDVEIQLAAQKARISHTQVEYIKKNDTIEWLQYKADEEYKRVGSLRFMASVEERILYVKGLRASASK